MPFTPEELEEMEKADQEIEESFVLTNEEIAMAREYDKRAKYEAMTGDKQKVAAYHKAYREANREKIAVAILGLVLQEADGQHTLMTGDAGQEEA